MIRSALLLLALPAVVHAQGTNCESLRREIEARIISAGVAAPLVTVVGADEPARGKVVGNCERGSRKIVYSQGPAGTAPAPRPASTGEQILTECKDGSMSVGGTCGKR